MLFLVIVLCASSCFNSKIKDEELKVRIINIGKELVLLKNTGKEDFKSNKNFLVDDVVNIGEKLFNLIDNSKPFNNNVEFNVKKGDVIPFGNGIADFTLEIIKQELNLKIRLKYDPEYDKFHILGFTTKW